MLITITFLLFFAEARISVGPPISIISSNSESSKAGLIEAASEKDYDKPREEVLGIMRTILKVKAGEDNDFELETNDEMIETFSGFTGGIKLFALSVSIIALVVAGIGIMNINFECPF